MIPRLKPVAPDTWEIRVNLPATDEETARVDIEFPGPSTVVGAYCSVVQASAVGGRLIAGVDNLIVLVDLDNQRRFTSGPQQGQTSAAARGSGYVTFGSLDSRVRDLYWHLDSARPVLGLIFRWKRFLAGTPFYEDVDIGFAVDVLAGVVHP
jgi:hypothetical protein